MIQASDSNEERTAFTIDNASFKPIERSACVLGDKGRAPVYTLVPLNQIMDERYSAYLRKNSIT